MNVARLFLILFLSSLESAMSHHGGPPPNFDPNQMQCCLIIEVLPFAGIRKYIVGLTIKTSSSQESLEVTPIIGNSIVIVFVFVARPTESTFPS